MEPRRSTESRCNNNRVEEKAVVVNNRGAWTAEEDMKLAQYVEIHGPKRWKTAAVKAGLNRCGKSCRLRWLNYLRPNIKRGNITEAEEDLIVRLHKLLGNRWSLIAGRLPGRTDNEIKNYWNSHLSKRIKQRRRNKKPEQSHQQQQQQQETMGKTPTPPPPLDDVVTSAQEWEEEEEVKRNKESEMMKEDGSKENDYDLLAEISFDVDDLFATDHHQGIYCNNSGGGLDKWLNDEFVDLDDSVDSSMMMNGWLWSNNCSTDSYYCM